MRHALEMLLAALALLGTAYYLLCVWSAAEFLAERRRMKRARRPDFAPPVSILKPVRGMDPGAYESFRTHCVQQYPEYEIIFGVGDADDPATPLVRQLMAEFPERRIELVVCREIHGMNRKVSNLLQMLPLARYQHVIVNDGDIRVPADYLTRVLAQFAEEDVGMVTCLYHGVAAKTVPSRLEALGISTEFSAGVLTARQLEGGIRFGLGSTLAFTRAALKVIGGLEPLVDYLADDYELGRRIAEAGHRVLLADVNVETQLPAYSFKQFFEHQLRWARSTRDSRPWGYFGLALTFGLPWAIAAAITASGATWSLHLLLAAFCARVLMALVVGVGVLRDRQIWRDLLLLPVRDVIALTVWVTSYFGHKVNWRGNYFILEDGKLKPAG